MNHFSRLTFVFTRRRRVCFLCQSVVNFSPSHPDPSSHLSVPDSRTPGTAGDSLFGKSHGRSGSLFSVDRCYCDWFWTNVDAVFLQLLVWRCCPEKGRVSRSWVGPAWTSSPPSEKVRCSSLEEIKSSQLSHDFLCRLLLPEVEVVF